MSARMFLPVLATVAMLTSAVRPGHAQPTFPEIVSRINQVNPTLQTFVVEPLVNIRILWIFRFQMRATLYAARPLSYKVVIHDPPWLLRGLGGVVAVVTSLEEFLVKYHASVIRAVDEGRLLLELVAVGQSANPPAAVVTIDTARWAPDELFLKYAWGEVRASFRYEAIGGYVLPVAVRVSVPGHLVQADLSFSHYRLNVPIPPGTFETAGADRD